MIPIIQNHKTWWLILIIATFLVSYVTSVEFIVTNMIQSMLGHLVFAAFVAFLPWLIFRVAGKPLTSLQVMWAFTMGWFMLAIANLSTAYFW